MAWMTTTKIVKVCEAMESHGLNPLDHLPPPASSNKPLTPFSITDILSKPTVKRTSRIHRLPASERPRQSITVSRQTLITQTSPLCALQELASKTFKGLELGVLQAAEGKDLVLEVLDCKKNILQFVYKYNLLTCIIIILILIIINKQTNKIALWKKSMDVKGSSYPCHYRTFNSNV